MPDTPKTICFDIDGCLCTQTAGDYEHAQPIQPAIALVNTLYDEGHRIVLHTARFMGRNANDVAKAHADGYEFTRAQLAAWGVRYHELVLGKPPAHVVVDDRAVFFPADWGAIEREVRRRIV